MGRRFKNILTNLGAFGQRFQKHLTNLGAFGQRFQNISTNLGAFGNCGWQHYSKCETEPNKLG
jgi:phage-related protein